jgi:hypothetical protein
VGRVGGENKEVGLGVRIKWVGLGVGRGRG